MKKSISIDVTSIVEAIEDLSKEIKELKKALLTNQGSYQKVSYSKAGPKQGGKYYKTKYPVKTIKLGYVVQLTINENSHAGKQVTPPRVLGSSWDEFPFVAAGSLTVRFMDGNNIVTNISKSLDRILINNEQELKTYLDNWYINTFDLIIKEVERQSDFETGRIKWNFKSYETKSVIEALQEKKISLLQL